MPRKIKEDQGLVYSCTAYLNRQWQETVERFVTAAPDEPESPLGEDHPLIPLIRDCLRSSSVSYHYVLPTQLLAKCVDPSLVAHSLQVGFGVPGAFDARTIAHQVVVPFDQNNYRVLGGSPEPYVNNPLRVPAVATEYRSAQKAKADWDKLVAVLDAVEDERSDLFTQRVFAQVLHEIYRLLATVRVTYPTPNRVSLDQTYFVMQQYLATKSGGDRMEAVSAALFQTIGERFGLFDQVRRQRVNATDSSAGMSADIECCLDGEVVLLVEIKDRMLTLIQLDSKLDAARAAHISEILFIAEQGEEANDKPGIAARIASEYASGQNIYVTNFTDFSLGILILFGEAGRVRFLRAVGDELDRVGSRIEHRKAWAELLKQI
jgi:hypothetical protein